MPKVKVTTAGFVAGSFHKAGTILDLSERQAQTGLRRGRVEILKESTPAVVPENKPDETPEVPALTLEETKAKLDALGVKYRANATLSTLSKLLAETVAEADPTA
jgi:hypothetical protein